MARILIVEDEHAEQLLLYSIFEGLGHEIYTVGDGERALKMYLRKDIQVVVTDLHMPKAGGLELIEALLDSYPGAAIIAVSGKGPALLAQAEALGVFAALAKPVDRDELLEAVANALATA